MSEDIKISSALTKSSNPSVADNFIDSWLDSITQVRRRPARWTSIHPQTPAQVTCAHCQRSAGSGLNARSSTLALSAPGSRASYTSPARRQQLRIHSLPSTTPPTPLPPRGRALSMLSINSQDVRLCLLRLAKGLDPEGAPYAMPHRSHLNATLIENVHHSDLSSLNEASRNSTATAR